MRARTIDLRRVQLRRIGKSANRAEPRHTAPLAFLGWNLELLLCNTSHELSRKCLGVIIDVGERTVHRCPTDLRAN
jgi:hypothetical protein